MPASDTVASETLLVIATDPVKLPVAVGANLIGRVADAPPAMLIGNVDPAKLKPLPVTVAPLIESEEPPVFDNVIVKVLEFPVTRLPKLSDVGDTDSLPGAGFIVPFAEADLLESATLVAVT